MRLMIVGQLEGYISTAGKIALQKGAKVLHCEDVEEALAALRNGRSADLAMVDIKQDIGKFVKSLASERIHIEVVACGIGSSDTRAAVKAIEDGAKEYIPLPPDAELIAAVLQAATEEQSDMIAADPAMKRVIMLADKIAPSEATVLITGESGTGKEVMSRYIHNKSKRKDGPFIALNCAAIPENLLESELFGHEKGAFTGATGRRIGKFEEANNGTILLDEITEMDISLQAKLLRVLQERVITRVGSNNDVKVNVRVIATSNRNLEETVEKKQFREDLYFRLNVMNIKLPALRERPGDILALAQFFADKYADANNMDHKKLSPAAQNMLEQYPWRGNIRELENTMHRAIIISIEDEIEAEAIMLEDSAFSGANRIDQGKASITTDESPSPAKEQPPQKISDTIKNPGAVEAYIGRPLADLERDMILDTLEHTLGNRTHAANILGISIRTLRNKLNQYKDEGVDIPASAG